MKKDKDVAYVDAQHIKECLDEKRQNEEFEVNSFIGTALKAELIKNNGSAFVYRKTIDEELKISIDSFKSQLVKRGFKVEEVMDCMTFVGIEISI